MMVERIVDEQLVEQASRLTERQWKEVVKSDPDERSYKVRQAVALIYFMDDWEKLQHARNIEARLTTQGERAFEYRYSRLLAHVFLMPTPTIGKI